MFYGILFIIVALFVVAAVIRWIVDGLHAMAAERRKVKSERLQRNNAKILADARERARIAFPDCLTFEEANDFIGAYPLLLTAWQERKTIVDLMTQVLSEWKANNGKTSAATSRALSNARFADPKGFKAATDKLPPLYSAATATGGMVKAAVIGRPWNAISDAISIAEEHSDLATTDEIALMQSASDEGVVEMPKVTLEDPQHIIDCGSAGRLELFSKDRVEKARAEAGVAEFIADLAKLVAASEIADRIVQNHEEISDARRRVERARIASITTPLHLLPKAPRSRR